MVKCLASTKAVTQSPTSSPKGSLFMLAITFPFQGMFVVSFPYTVLKGGYWAIISMVFFAWICCHTGKILVYCLYEPNLDGVPVRVRSSYMDIATAVWGPRWYFKALPPKIFLGISFFRNIF